MQTKSLTEAHSFLLKTGFTCYHFQVYFIFFSLFNKKKKRKALQRIVTFLYILYFKTIILYFVGWSRAKKLTYATILAYVLSFSCPL